MDEKRVILWGLLHGNVMISLVQQFECYAKVWEQYFVEEFIISASHSETEWFDNNDIQNSFNYAFSRRDKRLLPWK